MARPIKCGLDYFPLVTDFFSNKKIKNLRRAHGSIGVLTYLNLLCKVYQNGYYYRFDDLEELAMDIAEEIACTQLRATATSVTETINYLVGREILDEGLFKRGIISGVALQEQYILSMHKARQKVKFDMYALVDVNVVIQKNKIIAEETPVIAEETPVNDAEMTQSKINKNKVNKSIIVTQQQHARTRADDVKSCDIPTLNAVVDYFHSRGAEAPLTEATNFIDYNVKRGWDCLPEWTTAAEKWLDHIK